MSQRALASPVQAALQPLVGGNTLQRKCGDCGTHTPGGGECESCAKRSTVLQAQLSVGPVDDPLEREADRIADRVLSRGTGVGTIRRFAEPGTTVMTAPPGVDRALASSGAPLGAGVRRSMERGFGRDFSAVRVHSDAASARQLGARAYTVGNDIVFDKGQYAPATREGQRLLAHELAHVVQQSGGAASLQRDAYRGDGPGPGHPPRLTPGQKLAGELRDLIEGATWKEKGGVRERVYPKESAAGKVRAKERHDGTRPDLMGLGKLTNLEHFATAMRTLQANWVGLKTSKARVKEIGKIADTELTNVDVPGFEDVVPEKMEFKGYFRPSSWEYHVSKDLVAGNSLSTDDAAELANTTLHESRHAEQDFLAARFNAKTPGKDATAIHNENGIPIKIAQKAVDKKFDATTDPVVADLGKRMFDAGVTHGGDNQRISDDDGWKNMAAQRKRARKALRKLEHTENDDTIAEATKARDDLKQASADVESKYTNYRNIPYEADAHEVGDAEELAFRGWP